MSTAEKTSKTEASVERVWIEVAPDDQNGDGYVGVYACAQVNFLIAGETSGTVGPVVRSAGLWRIDSLAQRPIVAADVAWLRDVAAEQLDELDTYLGALSLPPVYRAAVNFDQIRAVA